MNDAADSGYEAAEAYLLEFQTADGRSARRRGHEHDPVALAALGGAAGTAGGFGEAVARDAEWDAARERLKRRFQQLTIIILLIALLWPSIVADLEAAYPGP